ncbi:MAG: YggS family pyridoxal phosphate-dependent enzyme [Thermodesulfobacteriota bacterium]|nr:YggS family pyridoxal phosphate-dependent enzyme [Thermodesulfobacteriota bacterium]
MDTIKENVKQLLSEIPGGVDIVAAAKTRSSDEILQAIDGGLKIIGQNYVQEALKIIEDIGHQVRWHFIGHLQKNKIKYVVPVFDMIETVDSMTLATQINKHAIKHNKTMHILIEINSGREPQKFGVFPEDAYNLIKEIKALSNLKIMGLMTMGKMVDDTQEIRKCFKETKTLFDEINALNIEGVEMKCLSMGMSDSYTIAIEEGANVVRIGTKIFGPRSY